MTFLDISFCKSVTDAGLAHFEGKTYPLVSLILNSLPSITGPALNSLIGTCTETLVELEVALNDTLKGEFFLNLARCTNMEYIDLTGDKLIDDNAFSNLPKFEITVGQEKLKPGMPYLHTLRLNGLAISNMTIYDLTKISKAIEHIEMAGCTQLTEDGISKLLLDCPDLKFIDFNANPGITYAFLDDIAQKKPALLVKRHKFQDVDFRKDNGLRIPRLIAGAKKKKKKGKKGKKKK